jgi:hypothetical protein
MKDKPFYEFVGALAMLFCCGNMAFAYVSEDKVTVLLCAFFAGIFAAVVMWAAHKYVEADL